MPRTLETDPSEAAGVSPQYFTLSLTPVSLFIIQPLSLGLPVTLVHYCEAGNRPRMVARKSPDQKTAEFDFVDISGNTTPAYLHHFVFTIINADHHTEDWTFMLPGDKLLHAHSI